MSVLAGTQLLFAMLLATMLQWSRLSPSWLCCVCVPLAILEVARFTRYGVRLPIVFLDPFGLIEFFPFFALVSRDATAGLALSLFILFPFTGVHCRSLCSWCWTLALWLPSFLNVGMRCFYVIRLLFRYRLRCTDVPSLGLVAFCARPCVRGWLACTCYFALYGLCSCG